VVIYDAPDASAESTGTRKLDPMTYYGRLTQRLLGAMTAPTRRGILFDVDMRLRPSGNKGPIATQRASFIDYYNTEAETWERMALTKARAVAGDISLMREMESVINHGIRSPLTRDKVAHDVMDMRQMLAKEKGDQDPFDMKLAAGALVDIDFIAAFLQIVHGCDQLSLHVASPALVLQNAQREGLISDEDAHVLIEARQMFNIVLQWERLLVAGRFDPTTLPPAVAGRVAAGVGLPDMKVLKAHLNDLRARVVSIRDHILA
jgi:glutamate-ammonia-ligase adenylyltransferase